MIVLLKEERTKNAYNEWEFRRDVINGNKLLHLYVEYTLRREKACKEYRRIKKWKKE